MTMKEDQENGDSLPVFAFQRHCDWLALRRWDEMRFFLLAVWDWCCLICSGNTMKWAVGLITSLDVKARVQWRRGFICWIWQPNSRLSWGWLQCTDILTDVQGCGVWSGNPKAHLRRCQSFRTPGVTTQRECWRSKTTACFGRRLNDTQRLNVLCQGHCKAAAGLCSPGWGTRIPRGCFLYQAWADPSEKSCYWTHRQWSKQSYEKE